MANSLVYFVDRGRLKGSIGKDLINIPAVSGAGRGRKNRPASEIDPSNKAKEPLSRNTLTEKQKSIRGGPIPLGFYTVLKPNVHETLGHSAFLDPLGIIQYLDGPRRTFTGGPKRGGGFYIHRRGPHGSDGCIVPVYQSDLDDLLVCLRNADGPVHLQVMA